MFKISVFFFEVPGWVTFVLFSRFFFKTGKLETLLHTQHYGMSVLCCELVLLLLTITYFI